MDPLVPAMGHLAVQSVRRQFEYEAEGEVSPTRPARAVLAARGLKRLVAKRRAAGGGPVPATERS
jgi:hypothetical protein